MIHTTCEGRNHNIRERNRLAQTGRLVRAEIIILGRGIGWHRQADL